MDAQELGMTDCQFEAFLARLKFVKWAREKKGLFREFMEYQDFPLPTWPVDFETAYVEEVKPVGSTAE